MTTLERIRLTARMTRTQLADKSGVSYSTICRLETGKHEISDDTLLKLADALSIDPLVLKGGTSTEPEPRAA